MHFHVDYPRDSHKCHALQSRPLDACPNTEPILQLTPLSIGIYRPTETRNEGRKRGKDYRMRSEEKETMEMITVIIAFPPQFIHTSLLTVCHWVTVGYPRQHWTARYCNKQPALPVGLT